MTGAVMLSRQSQALDFKFVSFDPVAQLPLARPRVGVPAAFVYDQANAFSGASEVLAVASMVVVKPGCKVTVCSEAIATSKTALPRLSLPTAPDPPPPQAVSAEAMVNAKPSFAELSTFVFIWNPFV